MNLAAYPAHVTVVFAHGAKLIDVEGKLKGSGSQVRHLRLTAPEDLLEPYVRELISQASALAPKPAAPIEYEIIVKVYKGPKRRPNP